MKKILIGTLLCLALVHSVGLAQSTQDKISVAVDDSTTLDAVIKAVDDKTDFRFVYDQDKLQTIPVSAFNFTNTTVEDILNYLEANYPIATEVSGDMVTVSYSDFLGDDAYLYDEIDSLGLGTYIDLNPLVIIGYGEKRKKDLTGAISNVEGESIEKAQVANVSNALAGRVPGLVSVQSSGQPGFDGADLRIRGFDNPLVIVDGIESDINKIDPNTIETVSVLKDASASIYGSRAGNGVILITTKAGSGKTAFKFSTTQTIQGVTTMPKPVSSWKYAEMRNQIHLNGGGDPATLPYSEDEIALFKSGTNPQYPNTRWYDEVFRDWAPQSTYNLSVSSGGDKTKFYGYIGYLNQETMIKKGGSGYERYNFVTNVDSDVTDEVNVKVNLSSSIGIKKYPWRGVSEGANSIWEDFWRTIPTYPATLPDPTKLSYAVGANTGGAHITSNRDIAGYNDQFLNNYNGSLILSYTPDFIDGLTFKALGNYKMDYNTRKNFTKPISFYTYDYNADMYELAGGLGDKAALTILEWKHRNLTGNFSLNYNKDFGDHHIDVLSLYEIIDYKTNFLTAGRTNFISDQIEDLYAGSNENMSADGSTSIMGRASFVNRLSYNYLSKYYLDLTLRADASAKFPKDERWGYFPSIAAAWRMSQEDFLIDSDVINELKFRLSYGEAGNDNIGNNLYMAGYKISNSPWDAISYVIGDTSFTGIIDLGIPNENLTWENMATYNLGLDFELWNRKLYSESNVFYREREGILATRANSFPSEFGATLPPENLNSLTDRGFDFLIGYKERVGDFKYNISANVMWSRAKWDHFEEPEYTDPDRERIYKKSGEWVDRNFGYLSDGLFMSQDEIDNLGFNQDNNSTPNATLQPGDVKYIDVNKDGVLDWRDQVEIGGTTPHWIVGSNMNFEFKGFSLSALFQGSFGYYTDLNLSTGSVYSDVYYDNLWEKNQDRDGLVPRLGGGVKKSDFRFQKAGYLRLKNLYLSYDIPVTDKLKAFTIFFSGSNILTFSPLNKYNVDPEAPSSRSSLYYPQQKTYSLGINVTF